MTPPIEEIARGLTEAQRTALVSLDDDHLPQDQFRELFALGILEIKDGWLTKVTDPLGLALRTHLQSRQP